LERNSVKIVFSVQERAGQPASDTPLPLLNSRGASTEHDSAPANILMNEKMEKRILSVLEIDVRVTWIVLT